VRQQENSHTGLPLDGIKVLEARKATLEMEFDPYEPRIALFSPRQCDPAILTEGARALLRLARPDDVMVVPVGGA